MLPADRSVYPAASMLQRTSQNPSPTPPACLHAPDPLPAAFPGAACSGETPVLIASTVVEVGVDVPEASVMLVEAAHRFGLAQLHQLRGRVGRGAKASRCFLMAPAEDAKATERLQVLEDSSNGLDIAQADLDIRWGGAARGGC